MTIITADDIKRSGATDLPTIISRVAGIDILNWAAADSDIGVRGYNQAYSPRLLVLINGREVYLDNYGYTSWANLPVELSEIRQIEVVRGPNSALFGFNAVGGVINIITFDPAYDNTNSLEAHGGTQNDFGASAVQTLHLGDRVSMRLSAGGERQDQWSNTVGGITPWSLHSMADVAAQLTPKTVLTLEGTWSRSAEDDESAIGTFEPTNYLTYSIRGVVTSDTPYGEIQAQSYLNHLSFRADGVDFENRVEVTSLQDLFKIGTRSTIRVAVEFRDNVINTQEINTGDIGYRVWAPSVMWDFAATSKLTLTAAARLDALRLYRTGGLPAGFPQVGSAWNQSTQALSVNLGAVYKLTELDTLRATYARGVQLPSLVDLGAFQASFGPPPYGFNVAGNPDLSPSVVSNYELSYDRAFPALNAKAGVKLFFQQTGDVIGTWDPAHPDVPATPTTNATLLMENVSNSQMDGFELSASGKLPAGFHWSADTTYTHVKDQALRTYNLIARETDFAQTTPSYRGNVSAGWSDARWSADAYVHYVSAYDANIGGILSSSPAYVSLAGRVGYQISDGVVAAVSGQNLGAARQIQGAANGLQAPSRVIFSLTKSW
jgi:iron complex outermembrane receptor protein